MSKSLFMLSRILLCCIPIVLCNLCSWVDPETMDVYAASIVKTDFTYETTNLSGSAQYYLSSYDGIALDDAGHLYNSSNVTINGRILTSYGEFNLRLPSLSGAQIYQEYVTGTSVRSTWVAYNLTPDQLPVPSSLAPHIVFIAAVLIITLPFLLARFLLQ